MARAVAGWSPVMSTGVMPAAWQAAMVAAADARGGSRMPIRPSSRSPRSISAAGGGAGPVGRRHRQDAEAVPGKLLGAGDSLVHGGGVAGDHFRHQHGFWRALADDAYASAG